MQVQTNKINRLVKNLRINKNNLFFFQINNKKTNMQKNPAKKVITIITARDSNWVWSCRCSLVIHSNIQHWALSNQHMLKCWSNQHALFSHNQTQRQGTNMFHAEQYRF